MTLRAALKTAPAYHFSPHPQSIKLDQNESPYDLPAELKARAIERLMALPFHRYPELSAESLRSSLSNYLNWPAEGIVVSNGSNVLIQAFVSAAGIAQQVLSVSPTFSVYALQAKLLEAELHSIPLENDFSLPLQGLLDALAHGRGVLFLANPAAPTGNLHSASELERLAEASAESWLMVIDEAYQQFSGTDYRYLVEAYPHVASLRTFSKAFGLGGLRLGYALMQAPLAEQLQKVLLPFSVSDLQSTVAEVVLEQPEYVAERVAECLAERQRLATALADLPQVTVFPSDTNFLLFRVPDAAATYQALLARDIVVRRQDHLPLLAGCLRVSVGTPQENSAFLSALADSLQEVVHV